MVPWQPMSQPVPVPTHACFAPLLPAHECLPADNNYRGELGQPDLVSTSGVEFWMDGIIMRRAIALLKQRNPNTKVRLGGRAQAWWQAWCGGAWCSLVCSRWQAICVWTVPGTGQRAQGLA